MTEDGYTLPDEERVNAGSKIRWAAGAMDGVTTHHMGTGENEETVRKTVELVLAYSRQPTATNKAAVYQHVIAEHVVSIIDPVIEALVNESGIGHDRLYELARSFVTEAPDREPVKFGIALLGLFRQPADQELFQTLGRHDEFTLFCAVAIANRPRTTTRRCGPWPATSPAGGGFMRSNGSPERRTRRSRTGCSGKGSGTRSCTNTSPRRAPGPGDCWPL